MIRVYISSTFQDLEECRAAVRQALARQSAFGVAMEDYVADTQRPVDVCLADVAQCDLYIGLFAWRYGHIPDGHDKSITHLEYEKARQQGIDCLIFMLDEDAPWPRAKMDKGDSATKLETLRAELGETHVVSFFTGPDDLDAKVTAALARRRDTARPAAAARALTDERLAAYYRRLAQQYGGLELESLTPAGADEDLQISLTSVFVEQHVRAAPPPPELPREWLTRMRDLGEIDDADLPGPLDPAELRNIREAYREKPLRPLFEALAVSDCPAVVMLGDPGSGKSTLARYLVLTLAGVGGGKRLPALAEHLPFLIELRSYVALAADGRCSDFLGYLDYRKNSDGLGLSREELEQYFAFGGRALIIFDGLDEVFDPRGRAEVAGRIVDFQVRHPTVRVVVTSRVIGYSRRVFAEAGFAHFTLQDLDEEQIDEFLGRWYPRAFPKRPREAEATRSRLLAAMTRSAALRELAGNPLLLTILAIIGKHQVLPKDRRTLYRHATGVLVEHWDVNRHLNLPDQPEFIDVRDKQALLCELAFHMQDSAHALSANYIDRQDLSKVFEQYLRARYQMSPVEARTVALAMIDQFRERNYILSRYGSELYGFVHRTFLEYFCAESVVAKFQHDQKWSLQDVQKLFRDHWADPSWREVLRLVAGALHERHTATLISLLAQQVNNRWPPGQFTRLPWNLALAVQCLGEAHKLHTDLATPARNLLKKLILLLEHSVGRNDPDIATLFGEEIVPAARAIGANWPGRQIYLTWYRRRGVRLVWSPTMTFAAQLAAILSVPDDDMAELFDGELAQLGDSRAAYAAVAGLAELAGPRSGKSAVREMLVRRVCEDQHASVRFAAVQAISERFDPDDELIGILREQARRDGSAGVRQAAVRALGERQEAAVQGRDVIEALAHDDPSPQVRRSAVQALSRHLPDDLALRATLERLLRSDDDAEVVTLAAQTLLDRFGAGDHVRRLLTDRIGPAEEGAVRRSAIRLLGERWATDVVVVDLLVASIETERDPGALCEAARCFLSLLLGRERLRARAGLITRSAADPDERIRLSAVQMLAEQFPEDEPARAAVLAVAGSDHDANVRMAAVAAIVRWAPGDPSSRAALEERVRDAGDDPAVRGAAMAGLVTAGWTGPAVRATLAELATRDPEPHIREQAIRLLVERYGSQPRLQRAIAECCRDSNREVRLATVQALKGLEDTSGLVTRTLIDRVREDPSGRVFRCAAEAVGPWLESGAGARPVLMRRAGGDANAHVRLAATEILGRLHGNDPKAQQVLRRLVRNDLDADVVRAAADALAGKTPSVPQASDLTARAIGADAAVRRAAVLALGKHYAASRSVQQTMLRAAEEDDDMQVRRQALVALAEFVPDRRAVRTALENGLTSTDWSVQQAAVHLLGQHFGTEAATVQRLVDLAEDGSHPDLSQLASQTLSWLPGADPERMPTLGPAT